MAFLSFLCSLFFVSNFFGVNSTPTGGQRGVKYYAYGKIQHQNVGVASRVLTYGQKLSILNENSTTLFSMCHSLFTDTPDEGLSESNSNSPQVSKRDIENEMILYMYHCVDIAIEFFSNIIFNYAFGILLHELVLLVALGIGVRAFCVKLDNIKMELTNHINSQHRTLTTQIGQAQADITNQLEQVQGDIRNQLEQLQDDLSNGITQLNDGSTSRFNNFSNDIKEMRTVVLNNLTSGFGGMGIGINGINDPIHTTNLGANKSLGSSSGTKFVQKSAWGQYMDDSTCLQKKNDDSTNFSDDDLMTKYFTGLKTGNILVNYKNTSTTNRLCTNNTIVGNSNNLGMVATANDIGVKSSKDDDENKEEGN